MPNADVYYVYILKCADGSYYVGSAREPSRRQNAHNAGHGAAWTARRRPVQLVYQEPCSTKEAAARREQQIKGWTRAKKEALVAGNGERLRRLSKRART